MTGDLEDKCYTVRNLIHKQQVFKQHVQRVLGA